MGMVIIAPMTTKSHTYPTRIKVDFENKIGWIVLDKLRTIDTTRLIKRLGTIEKKTIRRVKDTIRVYISVIYPFAVLRASCQAYQIKKRTTGISASAAGWPERSSASQPRKSWPPSRKLVNSLPPATG